MKIYGPTVFLHFIPATLATVSIGYGAGCLESKNASIIHGPCSKPADFVFDQETGKISKTKLIDNEPISKCWSIPKIPAEELASQTKFRIQLKSCRGPKNGPKAFRFSENRLRPVLAQEFCIDLKRIMPDMVFAVKCSDAYPETVSDVVAEKLDEIVEKNIGGLKHFLISNQTGELEKLSDDLKMTFSSTVYDFFQGYMKMEIDGMKSELENLTQNNGIILDAVKGLLELICEKNDNYYWDATNLKCVYDGDSDFENDDE